MKILQKQLELDASQVKRFEREAKVLAAMQHPNVVQVHDFGRDPQAGWYLVMDYLVGQELTDLIRCSGALDPARVIQIGRQAASAFAYAHARGVVHRDVKSANLFMLEGANGKLHAKVLDFGIARLASPEDGGGDNKLTQTGMVIGSPAYMAPEQALGMEVDARTDLYSLGIVLYEMLTGAVPFAGASALEVLTQHITKAPTPPKQLRPELDVPADLELVVLRCLQKSREDRYSSADELDKDLQKIEERLAGGQEPATEVTRAVEQLRATMFKESSRLAAASEEVRREAVGGARTAETRLDEAVEQSEEPAAGWTGKQVSLLVAAMLVVALLAGGALFLWAGHGGGGRSEAAPDKAPAPSPVPAATQPAPAPATAPKAPERPAVAPEETSVTVVVGTDPAGGTVRWADEAPEAARATPSALEVKAEDDGRSLVLTREGREETSVEIDWGKLRADKRLIVKLRPKPKPKPRPTVKTARPKKPKKTEPKAPAGQAKEPGWEDL